jgi:hypothetical protein
MNFLTPAPDTSPADRARFYGLDICICIALAFAAFLIYNANLRSISAGDTYPARYLPFSILRDHTLYLDKMAGVVAQGTPIPFWILPARNGREVSLYPVVTPVLVTPLYLPAFLWLDAKGWTEQRLDRTASFMEKLAASLIASLSTGLLYLLLLRRAGMGAAVLLTLAYAFGTNTWVIGSQALWQHGMGELLLVICLLLLTGPCNARAAFAAGAVCALITFNRPPDALFALALGLCGLWWAGHRIPLLIAGAIAAATPLLAYNYLAAGNAMGAYALRGDASFFHFGMIRGLAGLLFSPGRGLFVFTPFLLFVPFAIRRACADPRTRVLTIALYIAIVIQLLVYAKADWRAGGSWGPRWLTDMLPLLVWMLAPFVARMRGATRAAFLLAVAASVAVQVVGAFWYTGVSDVAIMAVMDGPTQLDAAWDFHNTPFLAELRHPSAPFTFLRKIDGGSIDTIRAGDREVREVPAGTEISIEGWTLTNNHTPVAMEAFLTSPHGSDELHGHMSIAHTSDFALRADVAATMRTDAATGWRVVMQTGNLPPGDYTLAVTAQASAGGAFRLIERLPFKILPRGPDAASIPDDALPAIARDVAARLRGDQQAPGYWLTSYTTAARFENPREEMNTFLTSMLVDLLGPAAHDAGLGDTLARARAHLFAQIEGNGLVRYHGLPDAPTIPTLGVVITPDADDTSLVWRITGGKPALLPGVLKTLDAYRTPGGLYRTWLAPRSQYVNLDPGKDPNPPDVAIQMHLLLFLAQADPSAARPLYTALQGAIAQDSLWVYYQQTPLIPILRQADLARAGYPLTLPPAHLQTAVPGQQPWLDACRLLAQYEAAAATPDNNVTPPSAAGTLALLKTLAGDDFAAIRNTPPLIFHNDLSASTARYYWSADFGYALWLRLYDEYARATGPAK